MIIMSDREWVEDHSRGEPKHPLIEKKFIRK
jgi:hypothetical protein